MVDGEQVCSSHSPLVNSSLMPHPTVHRQSCIRSTFQVTEREKYTNMRVQGRYHGFSMTACLHYHTLVVPMTSSLMSSRLQLVVPMVHCLRQDLVSWFSSSRVLAFLPNLCLHGSGSSLCRRCLPGHRHRQELVLMKCLDHWLADFSGGKILEVMKEGRGRGGNWTMGRKPPIGPARLTGVTYSVLRRD